MDDAILAPGTLLPDGGGRPDVYRIHEHLASGGMADVYAVTVSDPERMGTVMAMKVAKNPLRYPAFFREAWWQSGVAGVLPVEWTDHTIIDGKRRVMLLMPFLREGTMAARLHNRKYTQADAVLWAWSIADTLQEMGVLHLDLKPENILFFAGQPLVADFGLAVWADPEERKRWGDVIPTAGTPSYMAPEQHLHREDVSVLADMYAITLILYEMVHGALPWGHGESPEDIFDKKNDSYPAVFARTGHALLDDFIVGNLCPRRPQRRHQNYTDFKAELRKIHGTLIENHGPSDG